MLKKTKQNQKKKIYSASGLIFRRIAPLFFLKTIKRLHQIRGPDSPMKNHQQTDVAHWVGPTLTKFEWVDMHSGSLRAVIEFDFMEIGGTERRALRVQFMEIKSQRKWLSLFPFQNLRVLLFSPSHFTMLIPFRTNTLVLKVFICTNAHLIEN